MATKTRADEMHDALVELYGPGSISDLMRQYNRDFPESAKYLTPGWLSYIKSKGAVGASHGDLDFDFWKRRLDVNNFTPASALSTGLLKAWYEAPAASGTTVVSDNFTRVPTGPVTVVSDTFTRTPVVSDDFSEVDGTALNGKATDTGQVWVQLVGVGITVQGGKLKATASSASYVECGISDMAVQGTVVAAANYPELRARITDVSNSYILSANAGIVYKQVAAVYTSIGSFTSGDATYQFRCIATSLQVIKDGISVVNITDATFTTQTKAGVGFNISSAATIDDFSVTRADLGTAETGQTWINGISSSKIGINAFGYAFDAVSGVAEGGAVIDFGQADFDASVKCISGTGGIQFRYSDDSNRWWFDNGGVLRKRVAGVTSNVTVPAAGAANDVVRVVVLGNLISVLRNGVALTSATDSFNNSATKHGLFTAASTITLDNFTISTPATGVLDDFSEVDGTSLNGKATDTGQVWSIIQGNMVVNTGKVIHGAGGARAVIDIGIADVAVETTLTGIADDETIIVRVTDISNHYKLRTLNFTSPIFYKVVANVSTQLGTGGAFTDGTYQVRAIASSFTFLKDGVQLFALTDSTYLTQTKHGIGINAAGVKHDNFSVTRADLGFATGINGAQVPWVENNGEWGIDSSGQAVGNINGAIATVNTKAADIDLSVAINGASLTNSFLGLVWRYTDANNYYFAYQNNSGAIEVWKRVAGANTSLDGGTNGESVINTVLRVVHIGGSLNIFAAGVLVYTSAAESSLTTGTNHGLRTSFSGTITTGFDNFSVKTPTLAAGDGISVLPDLSGNNNHAVQLTAANQPKFGFGTITDSFTAADGTALAGKLTDTGQSWVVNVGAGVINGAKALQNGGGGLNATVETGMPDAITQLDIGLVSNFAAGIIFRYIDASNFMRLQFALSEVSIAKVVATVATNVYFSSTNYVGQTTVAKVTHKGSSINLTINNVSTTTLTESANSTGTKHGIHSSNPANTFDNFSVTSLAAGKAVINSFPNVAGGLLISSLTSKINTVLIVTMNRNAVFANYDGLLTGVDGTGSAAGQFLEGYANFNFFDGIDGAQNIITEYYKNGAQLTPISNGMIGPMQQTSIVGVMCRAGATYGTGMFIGQDRVNIVGARPWQGDIAAILIFEGALNYTDRKKVETYLQAKYGTPALAA